MVQSNSNLWLDADLWNKSLFIGTWQVRSNTFECTEISSGRKLGDVAKASLEDLDLAARSAKDAQQAWSNTHYEERSAIFRKAAEVAEQNSAEIVEWLVRESGSIPAKAAFELAFTVKVLREASAMPLQAHGQVLPSQRGRISLARRHPIGVVGVISPFNFPLSLAMRAVAPALAVGNAVVLKPDTRTAVCGGVVLAKLLEDAGLPPHVFQMLPGGADIGEALCRHPDVGMIQFTGSTHAGRMVGKVAGENLKKVSLELGGKNSLIVLDDADLDLAVSNATWGAFLHQGQICVSSGRILVHEKVAEAFTKRLADKVARLKVGNPLDSDVTIGPMINSAQASRVQSIVEDAVAQGAVVHSGGRAEGPFMQPTVLAQVGPGMTAFDQEVFGPVAVVSTFGSDSEAVELANSSEFGLSAGIISGSVGRAIALGEQLRVGLLHINDQTVNDEVVNPFGGFGSSGNGTSIGGPANWESFTQWQWMTIKNEATAYPF